MVAGVLCPECPWLSPRWSPFPLQGPCCLSGAGEGLHGSLLRALRPLIRTKDLCGFLPLIKVVWSAPTVGIGPSRAPPAPPTPPSLSLARLHRALGRQGLQ